MASDGRHIAAELRVLQEVVASAVHELSQPLNVVNLLADNALDDAATLQAAATADPAVFVGLRRRVEAIVEQAAKASDITRWVRAFAIGIGGQAGEFDPDAVIARIAGIFANDLHVAGVRLLYEPAPGKRVVSGDESLLAFALTETILWMSRILPAPAPPDTYDESTGREIRISINSDLPSRSAIVAISGDVLAGGSPRRAETEAVAGTSGMEGELPADLPLLSRVARAPDSSVTFAKNSGASLRIRISLPCAAVSVESGVGGDT